MKYYAVLDWMDHDNGDQIDGPFDTWYQAARAAIAAERACRARGITFPLAAVLTVGEEET